MSLVQGTVVGAFGGIVYHLDFWDLGMLPQVPAGPSGVGHAQCSTHTTPCPRNTGPCFCQYLRSSLAGGMGVVLRTGLTRAGDCRPTRPPLPGAGPESLAVRSQSRADWDSPHGPHRSAGVRETSSGCLRVGGRGGRGGVWSVLWALMGRPWEPYMSQ